MRAAPSILHRSGFPALQGVDPTRVPLWIPFECDQVTAQVCNMDMKAEAAATAEAGTIMSSDEDEQPEVSESQPSPIGSETLSDAPDI
jgi:hypothetical protein